MQKYKNLSHYQSLDPDVDRGDCQQRVKAGGNALPADHQATRLLLEPRKGPRGLEPRDDVLDRPAMVFLGLPAPLRALRPPPSFPPLLPERFGILAFSGREDLEAFARTASAARAALDRVKPWEHLRPLVPIGRCGPVRQRHAVPRGQAVDQDALALPPAGDARAPTLARGPKRRPRRHTPNESSHVPRPRLKSALAWQPTCPPPASAAANEASHSWTPLAARMVHHTTGSP
jgi:hypothetical protein